MDTRLVTLEKEGKAQKEAPPLTPPRRVRGERLQLIDRFAWRHLHSQLYTLNSALLVAGNKSPLVIYSYAEMKGKRRRRPDTFHGSGGTFQRILGVLA